MKLKPNPTRIVRIVPLKINHNGEIENKETNTFELTITRNILSSNQIDDHPSNLGGIVEEIVLFIPIEHPRVDVGKRPPC